MATKIQPVGDRILAKVEEVSNKTASGLYLPDNAKEKQKIAKVEAVGELARVIKVGDRIVYKSYGGEELKVDGVNYIILDEKDILAKLT